MYKKIIFIILIIFSFIACNNNSNTENTENDKSEIINVGIYTYFYPFGYMKNGKIAGFDYDIMNEIAKAANFKLKFHGMKFEDLLNALEAGKIDVVISAMTVTEERKKSIDFSKIYYTSKQVMLVKKNNNSITNIEDLKGKSVGVVKDTTGNIIVTNIDGVNVEVFDVGGSAVLALEVDKIDAFVFDKDPSLNFMKYSDNIKLIEIENSINEDYAIAVRKGNRELLEKINSGLSIIMNNGVYEELINKNFK